MSITEWLGNVAVATIQSMGYGGIVVLMALESTITPLPSEAVMPFVGYLVAQGHFNIFLAMLASTAGSICGSLTSYYLGYYGGERAVIRFGKYVFLDLEHLAWTERFFKKYGEKTIIASRFFPVVRHLISIPAGIGKMKLHRFIIFTAIGATMWNGFLLWVGMKLKEHWALFHEWLRPADYVVLFVIFIGLLWFVHQHMKLKTWKRNEK